MADEVLFEKRDRVGWVTLNRPDALNTISDDLTRAFHGVLDEIDRDPDIACVLIIGAGRAFCAGADLKFVHGFPAEERPAQINAFLGRVKDLLLRIEHCPKPVIGAANGLAAGGGLEILLCCDMVVADADATMSDGHANFGLLPGGGSSARLPRKVGPNKAKQMLFTGAAFSAHEMQIAGLVNVVAKTGELEAEIDSLTGQLAKKSAIGLSRMKALVDDGLEQPSELALRSELNACALHATSFDMMEGVQAFVDKRKPEFQGR